MMCNFDYYNRFEEPTLILCSPDDSEIGIIQNPVGLNTNLCFSDISDISYKIFWIDDPRQPEINDVYEKHIERRQVHVVGVGYFIITSVDEFEDSDGRYKTIQAKSCEYELNNINMPYIGGTYQLYKPENFPDKKTPAEIASQGDKYMNENCLLYEIMKTIPSWTLVDQDDLVGANDNHSSEMREKYIELAQRCRTFELDTTTVYSFLRNEFADSYQCFVVFDIENREIRIKRYEDVFKELPVVISDKNFLESCEVSTTIDNYVNSMRVEPVNGVSIGSVNPMGGNIIYNFDHDIASGLIDGELKEALIEWRKNISNSCMHSDIPTLDFPYPTYMVTPFYLDPESKESGISKVREWNDASARLSEYKLDLLELLSDKTNTDEVNKVNAQSLINSDSFLSDVGLTASEIHIYKNKLLENLSSAGKIKNIFILIATKRFNTIDNELIFKYHPYTATIEEESYYLLVAQTALADLMGSQSEFGSYINGFSAEKEALLTVRCGDVLMSNVDTNSLDKSALAEYENWKQNLNTVEEYLEAVTATKSRIDELIDFFSNAVKGYNAVLDLHTEQNGFQFNFREYYRKKGLSSDGCDRKSSELYAKLTRYFKEQTYTEDTVTITDSMTLDEKFQAEKDLYNSSVELLNTLSVPAYEITAKAESFMFSSEMLEAIKEIDTYENTDSVISLASAVNIELPNGDVPLFHLLKISTNFEDMSCDLTWGNRLNLSDPAAVFSDLQKVANSAANIVATERINWGINEDKVNELMLAKNADIDTTFRTMSNSLNDTTMGDDGFKCYALNDNGEPSYGMWCANGVMMFMSNKETPEMAIGRIIQSNGDVEYGFYGQSIIANTITADKIKVGSVSKGKNFVKNGSFEATTLTRADTQATGVNDTVGWVGFERKNTTWPEYTNLVHPAFNNTRCLRIYTSINSSGQPQVSGYVYSKEQIVLPAGNYVVSFNWACNKGHLNNFVNSTNDCGVYIGTEINNSDVARATINNSDIYMDYGEIYSGGNYFLKKRFYQKFSLEKETSVYVTITNRVGNYAYFDDVMIERSDIPNEYSPHVGEYYAKYTSIDDSGINIYSGKLNIFNNAGNTVFSANENGDLTITGTINAAAGNIGGWTIANNRLESTVFNGNDKYYTVGLNPVWGVKAGTGSQTLPVIYAGELGDLKNDQNPVSGCSFYVSHSGYMKAMSGNIGGWSLSANGFSQGNVGMSSNSSATKYAFYAGNSDDYNFSVTHSGSLFARNAIIDESLTLTTITPDSTKYQIELDGYRMVLSSGGLSSAISFITTSDDSIGWVDGKKNQANLAIAGSDRIVFGTRPGNAWKSLCEIRQTLNGDTFSSFHFQPVSGLTSFAYLGSSTKRWSDLYLDGLTSITGVATGSVRNYINWCETKINYLLSKDFIESLLDALLPML